MLLFLLMVSVLALGACSSSKKQKDVVQVQQAPAAVVSGAAPKAEKSPDQLRSYTCQVLNDKRIVKFKTKVGRCEIHYTKFGQSESVAWAEATPSICSDVFARIRTNIEGRGFSCEKANKDLAAN